MVKNLVSSPPPGDYGREILSNPSFSYSVLKAFLSYLIKANITTSSQIETITSPLLTLGTAAISFQSFSGVSLVTDVVSPVIVAPPPVPGCSVVSGSSSSSHRLCCRLASTIPIRIRHCSSFSCRLLQPTTILVRLHDWKLLCSSV
ncbi:hypothetical protein PIB30_076948 [Stylosanthes scabra]|uniref:Uncharacterized protein n=1 Tax=Stylosanthes scabra TaxID=79078 RepID=A0ABU6WTU8_9FABA|nr:hypothetical protein [Stylosanthes scabra]